MPPADPPPQRPRDPADSAFNIHLLLDRCLGDPRLALLILDKLEQQLTLDVAAFEQLRLVDDAEAIARRAHALKGAAGATAADHLRALAAHVEHSARAGALELATESLAHLRDEIDRCISSLPAVRLLLAATQAQKESAS